MEMAVNSRDCDHQGNPFRDRCELICMCNLETGNTLPPADYDGPHPDFIATGPDIANVENIATVH